MPDLGFLDFLTHGTFWRYAALPFWSAIVGYITNIIAIKMMFYPIEFWGIFRPIGGWQGIIPRKAAKMAAIATDAILDNLLSAQEVFQRMDPEKIAALMETPLKETMPDLVHEVMTQHHPEIWSRMPEGARQNVIERVQAAVPEAIAETVRDLHENVDQVLDLKNMIVTRLVHEKELMNNIFQETGSEEFKFIARSGIYFGFPLGFIEMLIWLVWQPIWLLPVVGLFVGYITNWLALKMIFNPKKKYKIAGIEWHGLFFKRQKDVAAAYGDIISREVLAPSNILQQVLKGPYSDRIFSVIAHRVGESIDKSAGVAAPFVNWTIGDANYLRLKETAVHRLMEQTPDVYSGESEAMNEFIQYSQEAMEIKASLVERMQNLPAKEFEAMLRPAFEEDEWILIAAGAALGFVIGIVKLVVLFGSALH